MTDAHPRRGSRGRALIWLIVPLWFLISVALLVRSAAEADDAPRPDAAARAAR